MTQGGQGATPERAKKGAIKTIETMTAGEFAQRDEWPDIVAYMLSQGMLNADDEYGWTDYCRIRIGAFGNDISSGSGQGFNYQAWILFGQLIGRARLNWLSELWDYPVPRNAQECFSTRWRLNRCMDKIRSALAAATEAATEARKQIDLLRDTQ
jgi:hypothetical protein